MTGRRAIEPVEDVDLRYYWSVLMSQRGLILGMTVVAGLLAGGVAWLKPRVYESTMYLMVATPKVLEGERTSVSMATYRAMLSGPALLSTVLQEFGLNGPPHGFTPERFAAEALVVNDERNTNLLRVTVALGAPDLAAKVANRVAHLGVDASRRLSQEEAVEAREAIRLQVDEARQQFIDKSAELVKFKTEAQVDVLRRDVEAQLEQRAGLLRLAVQTAGERARAQRADQERSKRDRVETFRRSIDWDPLVLESARAAGAAGGGLLGLGLESQESNPVFYRLDQESAIASAALAGLEAQRVQLEQRQVTASRMEPVSRLYGLEQRLAQLELELQIAQQVYREISVRYESARAQVAGRSPLLQVVVEAIPPSTPRSRGVVRNAVLAGVAAFAVACVGALLRRAVAPS